MKDIVNVSGGLTSFEALRRTIERYSKENRMLSSVDQALSIWYHTLYTLFIIFSAGFPHYQFRKEVVR
jgi:hypothetical protein